MRASPSPLKTKPRTSLSNENDLSDLPRKIMSHRQSLGGRLPLSVVSLNKQGGDGKGMEEKVSKDFRPSLSDPQLSTLYSECIKLATANKVNQQNAWSLQLIDYMDEVIMKANDFKDIEVPEDGEESAVLLEALAYDRHIKQAKDGVPRMNFQKASCTLDASVMIYSHRVDSVHKDTFKVLGAFNRGGGEEGTDEAGDNGEGEVKKKKTRQHFVSTIETNLSNLNVKLFDLESQTDPVFKKTSASFDQGGARGLLLNNLGNYEGCKVAFDSDIVPDGNFEAYCDDSEIADAKRARHIMEKEAQAASAAVNVNIDASEIWACMGAVLGVKSEEVLESVGRLDLCPGLTQFYESLDGLTDSDTVPPQKKGSHMTAKEESESEEESLSQALAADLVIGDVEPFEAMDDLDRAIEHEEQGGMLSQGEGEEEVQESSFVRPTALAARGQLLSAATSPGGGGLEAGESDDSEGEVPDLPLVFSDQKEDLAFIDSALLKNWAGGSHWKFHGPKGASRAGGEARKAKAAFQIDFFDGELVKESAFAKPGPRANTSIAKATLMKADPSKFLLPEDLLVSATSIQQLFTRPVFVGFRPKKPASSELSRRSLALGNGEEHGEDEGLSNDISQLNLNETEDMEERGGNHIPFRQSLGGPEVEDSDDDDGGEQRDVSTFADFDTKLDLVAQPQMVGKVDIKFAKFAKKVDVRQLKNSLWNGIEIKKTTEPKSFQQTMNFLSTSLPPTALQNISVSYCFICLLHLCNEKNLSLTPKTEFDGSTHEKSPNDIGYSLADFEIRNN